MVKNANVYPTSQRLLLALKEARLKLEQVERSQHEPIALVGLGCRFPGGANDPVAFWELLRQGQDAISEVPSSRWDVDAYYDPDPQAQGKMYVRSGGFLDGPVDTFDPHFFGIAPREALSLDPQQRLLLEVTWEALEHAGQSPAQLAKTRTGVFIGIGRDDYFNLIAPGGYLSEDISLYGGIGNGYPFASGRISYHLGLQGPNLAIDTACSSSLVATHLAIASLRSQESDLALVGGVQLMLSPAPTITLSQLGVLSPDGRCKVFDARANGFSRGEGCGIVVLKRLSDAVAAGDKVWAVLLGSAVNHDGPSSGLTVPSEQAQASLIRQALQNAQVKPDAVHYIEAHGTGTELGDPIELGALGDVFGHTRPQPLIVGAVKSNLGHLEAAAGVAGLIKTVLALHYGEIPPQCHFQQPNPHAAWDQLSVHIPTSLTPWPKLLDEQTQPIAGISSFGMSGTNAHIVLAAVPSAKSADTVQSPTATHHVLTLSAKTEGALHELAIQYKNVLTTSPNLADICFTANAGRSHFPHRLAITATSPAEIQDDLAGFLTQQETIGLVQGHIARSQPGPKIAFLFTGQGAQYPNMGHDLYQTQPIFRQAIDQCQEILQPYLDIPLCDLLYPPATSHQPPTPIHQTAYTQPTLFALEYALAQLWLSWDIQPDYVMGHSVGEYVAACIAGVFSLEDGLKLIAERGRLMQALPAEGLMVSVMAGVAQVVQCLPGPNASGGQPLLAPVDGPNQVDIAAINGPQTVVISGQRAAVGAAEQRLQAKGIKTRSLEVSHAFHSSLMGPILADFEPIAQTISYAPPQIPLIANLTGEAATSEIASPAYWVAQVRQPIQFAKGMSSLHQAGVTCFLEIGPKPTLLGLGRQNLPADEGTWLPSLSPKLADWQQILSSVAHLYAQGFRLDWQNFYQSFAQTSPRRKVVLPTYPFQRERYWVDAKSINQPLLKTTQDKGHPLLGKRHLTALKHAEVVFEAQIGFDSPAYLTDHRVQGRLILPGAGYIEMALAAGAEYFKWSPQTANGSALLIETLSIPQALILPEDDPNEAAQARLAPKQSLGTKSVQLILTPQAEDSSHARFQIYSLAKPDPETDAEPIWTLHASGLITHKNLGSEADKISMPHPNSLDFSKSLSIAEHYQALQARGLDYGLLFQVIEKMTVVEKSTQNEAVAWGQVCLPEGQHRPAYHLHPLLLDGCFQLMVTLAQDYASSTYVPVSFEDIILYRQPLQRLWAKVARSTSERCRRDEFAFSLHLFDEVGLIASVTNLIARRVEPGSLDRQAQADGAQARPKWRDWLYELAWRPRPSLLPPDYLPEPPVLAADSKVIQMMETQDATLAEAEGLIDQLEAQSLSYVLAAFQRMGWPLSPGQGMSSQARLGYAGVGSIEQQNSANTMYSTATAQQISIQSLADQLKVIPRHRRLFERLLMILAEAGYLQAAKGFWTVLKPLEQPSSIGPLLSAQARQSYNEFVLLDRCGVKLAEVLQGKVDPLDLLFPDSDFSTTAAIYQYSAMARLSNALMRQVFETALKSLPQGRGIRILEIGAGTGGTTAYLLPALNKFDLLPEQTHYVFTDISPAFLTQAQKKFSDYPFVHYQVLDIEQNPLDQGFPAEGYDLIIAANVLHATRDLQQTIQHVRRLLAPQGTIIALEATLRRRWVDLTFGLTEGWWLFTDKHLRSDHPLLTAPQWRALLAQTGFAKAETLTQSAVLAQTVLIGQATDVPQPSQSLNRPWLIFADEQQGIGLQLATALAQRGERPTLVFRDRPMQTQLGQAETTRPSRAWDDIQSLTIRPDDPADHQALCQRIALGERWQGVVYLWGLDADLAETDLDADLENIHRTRIEPALLMVQALLRASQSPRLWLVTQGAVACSANTLYSTQSRSDLPLAGLVQAGLWGLGRVISLEHPEFRCTQVDLEPDEANKPSDTVGEPEGRGRSLSLPKAEAAQSQASTSSAHMIYGSPTVSSSQVRQGSALGPLLAEIWADSLNTPVALEDQIAFRKQDLALAETRYVARLADFAKTSGPHWVGGEDPASAIEMNNIEGPIQLDIQTRGSIDALVLQPLTRRPPERGEVEIRVRAAGLNFRDLLNVLDLYPERPPLGGECAGEVVAVGPGLTDLAVGDRVVALTLGSFADYVTVAADFVVPISNISLVEAATLATAFLTASLGLQQQAQLKKGDRVLIHAGSGGVGQAAIQIAQQIGAEIFATASPAKWDALRALGVQHIYNSRSLDFAEQIMADTEGQGVNVVLNSLTGPGFIEKSLSVLADKGHFVEIARRDVWTSEQMAATRPDVSYTLLNVAQMMDEEGQHIQRIQSLLKQVMQQVRQGILRPLTHQVYPLQQAVDAFRAMQQAKHVGKIVLQTSPQKDEKLTFRPDGSYLITGGLGGLGLLVAKWMVERGARHIILTGRRIPSAAVQAKVADLEALGATVVVKQADVTQRDVMADILDNLEKPLRGLIHSVGVLDDGVLQRQEWSRFASVMGPKAEGAWYLHRLTEAIPLDFFILFSSATSLLGNAGQANHAAANAFMDALAHYRRAKGLPALSINWGAWSEVGAAAQRLEMLKQIDGLISPQAGLESLEFLVNTNTSQAAVVPLDRARRAQDEAQGRGKTFYAEIAAKQETANTMYSTQAQRVRSQTEFLTELASAHGHERRGMLENYVGLLVAKTLGVRQAVPLTEGFFDLGMDSLTSVELRNRLQQGLDCELPTTLTFDYPTGEMLVEYLAQQVLADLFNEFHKASDQPEADVRPLDTDVAALENGNAHVDEDDDLSEGELDLDDIAQRLADKLGVEDFSLE